MKNPYLLWCANPTWIQVKRGFQLGSKYSIPASGIQLGSKQAVLAPSRLTHTKPISSVLTAFGHECD
ncbi:hypothetical protein PRIPAC_74673 [Pristionchus pacificus]|uniref:Uncharacterized protein n=1 Tax=Pristionchus pacificus TaxID=54126 RepID=A0A2A6D0A1_PRIPA|nr:hypothetical protein PRIPAC_74673 [Pristionchus pacificus]|eukprot:PDM83835.1 hypothetical protein PRIPAC_30322 [Pristionchus pacificus]